jgi:hypothetical protein
MLLYNPIAAAAKTQAPTAASSENPGSEAGREKSLLNISLQILLFLKPFPEQTSCLGVNAR